VSGCANANVGARIKIRIADFKFRIIGRLMTQIWQMRFAAAKVQKFEGALQPTGAGS
jgi:hypothetical protein